MINKRILLIGENGEDGWVSGPVRLSPESPTCILKPTKKHVNPGMAANVYANIKSLSPETKIDFFHQTDIITKTRYIDEESEYQLFRLDENDDAFEPDFWQKIVSGMTQNKDGYKVVVFSDYGKNLISFELIKNLTDVAHELGIMTWLDTKKILGEWSKDIDFVKINDKEFKNQLKAGVEKPWKWCRNLIVTRGKHGVDLYNQNGKIIYHVDAINLNVWSVSGCGDTVLAALVVKFLETKDIQESMRFAMKAAAIAVSKPGVVAVTRKEVEELS